MKKVKEFCDQNGLVFVPIRYTSQGISLRRKGFDICKKNGEIIVSLEPKSYRKDSIYSKDKWWIACVSENYNGPRYLSSITKNFLRSLDLNESTSTFVNIPQ